MYEKGRKDDKKTGGFSSNKLKRSTKFPSIKKGESSRAGQEQSTLENLPNQQEPLKSRFSAYDNDTFEQQQLTQAERAMDLDLSGMALNSIEKNDELQSGNHFTSIGTEREDDDDPNSEFLDDNFDEEIKPQLPQPTADGTIQNAVNKGSDRDVILWRSTTGASVAKIKANKSAGGDSANASATIPTHEAKQKQISSGGKLPEYTASSDLTGFSWQHWLVVVKINTKYLTRGSASESGWVCNPAAPVVVLNTVDRTLGLPEKKGVGAA